ncbi:ABC transporter ATP-binding protein [Bacillus cereus]
MKFLPWIWKVVINNKILYVLSFLLLLIESMAYIASTFLQQRLIDEIFINGKYHEITYVVSLMAVAYVSYSVLFTVNSYILYKNIGLYLRNLSTLSLNHLYKLPTVKLQEKRVGEYINHFSVDVENTSGLLGWDIPRIIQQFFAIFIILFIIGYNSIYIAIPLIALNVIFIVISRYYSDNLYRISKIINKKYSKITVRLEECVSSSKEILLFNRREWEKKEVRKLYNHYHKYTLKEENIRSQQLFINEILKWGTVLIVIGIGCYDISNGTMSIGGLVVAYQLSLQLTDAIQYMYDLIIKAIKRAPSVKNIKKEYSRSTIKSQEEERISSNSSVNLQVEGLYYKYPGNINYSLEDISLKVPAGKKVAFVGSSGSGKTTLLNLLLNFDMPTKGSIKINNHLITKCKNEDWYKYVSVVFQEPFILADTIKNNITLGADISEQKLEEICELMCLKDDINELPCKYNTILGERGVTLSGGQRQRLALARALISNPEILILDEATSALDIATESAIMKNLDLYRRNKTTIIVAHRLSTIKNSDIIYVFDNGKIIEVGKHEQLLKNNLIYSSLVKHDIQDGLKVNSY